MTVEEKVIKIISNVFKLSEDDFYINSNLSEDMGADSMDMLTIVASIENEFSLAINSEDIYLFKTPEDIINYLKRETSA